MFFNNPCWQHGKLSVMTLSMPLNIGNCNQTQLRNRFIKKHNSFQIHQRHNSEETNFQENSDNRNCINTLEELNMTAHGLNKRAQSI